MEPKRLQALWRRHEPQRGPGTLAEHVKALLGVRRSDSTLAERRAVLPWALFAELLQAGLRPLAQKKKHPHAFWRGWRLLALDGTQFSVSNTPRRRTRGRGVGCEVVCPLEPCPEYASSFVEGVKR